METKLFIKVIDGVTVKENRNFIVLEKDGLQIINPTDEMLFEDGWVEYIKPEISEIERLYIAKDNKVQEILDYDKSSNVNIFTVESIPVWLDKETRAGLMLRLQAEEIMGKETTTLWYEGLSFTLTLVQAKQLLYAIENYASMCYDRTQEHLITVKGLGTIKEVEEYDFTTGYPEALNFSLTEPKVEEEDTLESAEPEDDVENNV